MTIYRIYSQNGHHTGFWVQHRQWQNVCGRVRTVGGRAEGPLPGPAIEQDRAEVTIDYFDVRSGRPVQTAPSITAPGDKSFARIAEPAWARGRSSSIADLLATP